MDVDGESRTQLCLSVFERGENFERGKRKGRSRVVDPLA